MRRGFADQSVTTTENSGMVNSVFPLFTLNVENVRISLLLKWFNIFAFVAVTLFPSILFSQISQSLQSYVSRKKTIAKLLSDNSTVKPFFNRSLLMCKVESYEYPEIVARMSFVFGRYRTESSGGCCWACVDVPNASIMISNSCLPE